MIGRDNTTGGEDFSTGVDTSNCDASVVYRSMISSAFGSVIRILSGLRSFGEVRGGVRYGGDICKKAILPVWTIRHSR